MNDETAEKVAFLVLHGAEPMRMDRRAPMWCIILRQGVLAYDSGRFSGSRSWNVYHLRYTPESGSYLPTTWDEMSADMQTLRWPMIHDFLGTTP
jgi:hypothetical protein